MQLNGDKNGGSCDCFASTMQRAGVNFSIAQFPFMPDQFLMAYLALSFYLVMCKFKDFIHSQNGEKK